MKLIDADDLLKREEIYTVDVSPSEKVEILPIEIIANAPTIEAEPVVRCKDCENLEYEEREGRIVMFCNHFGDDISFHGMTENDFCSRGGRREP